MSISMRSSDAEASATCAFFSKTCADFSDTSPSRSSKRAREKAADLSKLSILLNSRLAFFSEVFWTRSAAFWRSNKAAALLRSVISRPAASVAIIEPFCTRSPTATETRLMVPLIRADNTPDWRATTLPTI